jgi:hypothetical protein
MKNSAISIFENEFILKKLLLLFILSMWKLTLGHGSGN